MRHAHMCLLTGTDMGTEQPACDKYHKMTLMVWLQLFSNSISSALWVTNYSLIWKTSAGATLDFDSTDTVHTTESFDKRWLGIVYFILFFSQTLNKEC